MLRHSCRGTLLFAVALPGTFFNKWQMNKFILLKRRTEGKQHTARECAYLLLAVCKDKSYGGGCFIGFESSIRGSSMQGELIVIEDLRERYFGPSFEFQLHEKKSPEICAIHEKDPSTRPEEGGESVDDVVARLASAMETMESEYRGCVILVVSHGDPLQILQTILKAASKQMGSSCGNLASRIQAVRIPSILSQHRKFALLTGELRTVL
ncbi:hypothetical protein F3Y22_tig00117048pilonHSYRG00082 [Hibiscus syriacus]|uniref:Uncharacterized protein n=1 Tax=Hibiscus syriacus TaxID=106335 RepID=A0A6A2WBT5_HIBSY|nr:hypothetical protein F3Y22_tig00117048pilonHSYRG00082 [Hibiscus syriacus]